MYGLSGERDLTEKILDHLDGYAGSRPVRVDNDAYNQMQLDVHGEVLDWALLRVALGLRLRKDEASYLRASANHVGRVWRKPEQGLWETRGGSRDFVHGKAMAWAALDRAIRLFGADPAWEAARADILAAIRQSGVAGEPPYLVQAFGTGEVDAALLQVPMLGMPLDEALLAETVRRIERDLGDGDLVYRYKGEDGLAGGEGAFPITSFWLVDALLAVGRGDEAHRLFERLLARANDVGLYAEEADVRTGGFLGNFPQAFTHLALISSATLLHLHGMGGPRALRGTHADRARRLVCATEGLRALLY